MATYILKIYVPAKGTFLRSSILPGSGIVGSQARPPFEGLVRVDYEGNKFNSSDLRTLEQKLFHAAGRHLYNHGRGYPTIARSTVEPSELIEVGEMVVDDQTWRYTITITDQVALDEWTSNGKTQSS